MADDLEFRRSLRRAVTLDCCFESDTWDGPVSLLATDLSERGLWVETSLALQRGEEVVVSFVPPDDPIQTRLWATASVVRVGLYRRRSDGEPSGMGLAFTYLSDGDRERLGRCLQGRPPPLPPKGAFPPALPGRPPQESAESDGMGLPAVLDTAWATGTC